MRRPAIDLDARDIPGLERALAGMITGRGPALMPRAGEAGAPSRVPEGVDLVIHTSGSSGVPKRIAHSRAALIASAEATARALEGPGTWLMPLPGHYIAGLQILIRSILAGTVPERPPAGSFDPARFNAAARRLFARSNGPTYTSLVPAQLSALLAADGGELSGFSAVLVGGQAVPMPLRERARAAGVNIVRTYGSSETGGGCVYDGIPLDGVSARIVSGEIRLSGPVLAAGYLDERGEWDRELTDAVFHAGPPRSLRTGDSGDIRDGVLSVTGRLDNVIISGGINVNLDRVESVVLGVSSAADAVIIGAPDPRWGEVPVLVSAEAITEAEFSRIRAACAAELGREARPARAVRLDPLPRLSSGKPDRRRIAAVISPGSVPEVPIA